MESNRAALLALCALFTAGTIITVAALITDAMKACQ